MSVFGDYLTITPSAYPTFSSTIRSTPVWTSDTDVVSSLVAPDVDDPVAHELDGVKYISSAELWKKHAHQMQPPKNGWVHGSRVMCAMRNKSTNEYFPRVTCYVHREGNEVYLIQKCCKGSPPSNWPAQFDSRVYVSWTIRSGGSVFMESEQVAYLGCCEGRNAL